MSPRKRIIAWLFCIAALLTATGCSPLVGRSRTTDVEEAEMAVAEAPEYDTATATAPSATPESPTTSAASEATASPSHTATTARPTTTFTTTTTAARHVVQAPYISQEGFPTGCESASAVMLLRFWGINVRMDTFVDNYLDKQSMRWENGRAIGPHPADAFVGNPRSEEAYGCFAPVIVRALERCVPAGKQVVNETGASLPELCSRYIDHDMPVMIWASIAMIPTYESDRWTTPSGETFAWPANEHCLLLVGYDNNNYYLNDPYKGRGRVTYARARVEQRYRELGCQAIGILPTQTPPST